MKLWRLILFFLILVGAVAWLVSLSPAFQECIDNHEAKNYGQNPKEGAAYLSLVFSGLTGCLGVFIDENDTAISAASTLLIAAFTGVLWWSTHSLGKAARRDFVATHRPRVIVRYIDEPSIVNGYESVGIWIVNIGETDATVVASDVKIFKKMPGAVISITCHPRVKAIKAVTLSSGKRHHLHISSDQPWTENDLWRETAMDEAVCVWGEIRYRDGNGTERHTGFYRVFDRKTQSYSIPENDPREYQD